MLLKGVAVHHSGLLPILKELVEILFQEHLIKVCPSLVAIAWSTWSRVRQAANNVHSRYALCRGLTGRCVTCRLYLRRRRLLWG